MSSIVPGTNVAPVSFPGIASGIDYNAIITKLTSLTLEPNVQLNAQIGTLNAANLELIKIDGLLSSVQTSLQNLSKPESFDAWSATSSDTNAATAQGIAGQTATPGTYVVQSTSVATATSVTNDPAAGRNIRGTLTSGPYAGRASDTVPLADSYAAVTPSNGSTSTGKLTVDGVVVTYDVTSQSLDTILSAITTAVKAVDPGFSATLSAGGVVTFASTDKPISLGSSADSGNLLDVLKLTGARVANTAGSGGVTGTSDVGGINQATALNASTAAGFATPVTSGTFTINGVSVSVDVTKDNLASVLSRINASAAGVVATYDASSNKIVLTNKATGPESIVLGAPGDGSNFFSAAGLTTSGAATSLGTQAHVVLQSPSGATHTVYSNSNTVTTAIAGVSLDIVSSSSTPFTISVARDTTQLVGALNGFVSAYNAAITEIDQATAAPVVPSLPTDSLPGAQTQALGGGILYNNADVESIKNQLTDIVSGILNPSDPSLNSLSQIGLSLSSSFTTLTANNGSSNSAGQTLGGTQDQPVQTTTFQGTDGTLQPLDASKLQAALTNDPSGVQALVAATSGLAGSLGTYLTSVTGAPTLLQSGPVGNIPTVSLMQGFENANSDTISSLQKQVKQITDNANAQADLLRTEFTATEGQLAVYQSLQSQLAGFFKQTGG